MRWPFALMIALSTQFFCQVLKLFYESLKNRKFRIQYLTSPGGFPSGHSAFVTSLAITMALQAGVSSDSFAIAATFGAIVIYDALKLRGVVQKQAILLNKLTRDRFPEYYSDLPEMVGHTAFEIAGGIVISLLVTIPMNFLIW